MKVQNYLFIYLFVDQINVANFSRSTEHCLFIAISFSFNLRLVNKIPKVKEQKQLVLILCELTNLS